MVVYDVSDRKSFEWADKWIECSFSHLSEGCIKILCGNKIDLSSERTVTTEEGMNKAEDSNMYFYETSAKEDINIEEMFEIAVNEMKQRKDDSSLFSGFMKDSLNLKNSSIFHKKKK